MKDGRKRHRENESTEPLNANLSEVATAAEIENIKYRLNRRTVLLDKFLLALLFVILGYFLNKSLESYKGSQAVDLETYKSSMQKQIEEYKVGAQQESEQARRRQDSDIANLKLEQDRNLALVRLEQDRNIEVLRTDLNFQGGLATRRLKAYEEVWNAGSRFALFFVENRKPERAEFEKRRAEFRQTLIENMLFLDSKSSEAFRESANVEMLKDGKLDDNLFIEKLEAAIRALKFRMYTALSPLNKRSALSLADIEHKVVPQ